MSELTDARCAILRALRGLRMVGNARALMTVTRLPPDTLQRALRSLEVDQWVYYDRTILDGVYRLEPARRMRHIRLKEQQEEEA
jgi:DNA-binding IclR family transcriptional regulator